MRGPLADPKVRAVVVGVVAGVLFLVIQAAMGEVGATEYITAVGVAIGGAIGSEFGRRRAERGRRRRPPDRP